MERYTTREGNEVRVRPEQLEQALARLAQFEDMAQGLDREQAEIAQTLEQLRSQGREKTVHCIFKLFILIIFKIPENPFIQLFCGKRRL